MEHFDPNALAQKDATIFGLPARPQEAYIHILPLTWDVTTSYRPGTALAPQQIFDASMQVDVYDEAYPDTWKNGYFFLPPDPHMATLNRTHRPLAEQVILALSQGDAPPHAALDSVNLACEEMNRYVYQSAMHTLQHGKKSILLGGDHSTPLGHLQAMADYYGEPFGVLVVDAHMDMRPAYEGFTYSHASIFYNALERFPQIEGLTSVGIRDYCEQEKQYADSQSPRVNVFYNRHIKRSLFQGETWLSVVDRIVRTLPQNLYVSIDIDGLSAEYCPCTGTPVAGGLEIDQLYYLLETLTHAGKRIIGADLCEVGHCQDEWDANVGARVLYKLCNMISSQR